MCLLTTATQKRHVAASIRKREIRGSPIGFSGSGIWLISRPGFGGILKEEGGEIPDCYYDRHTGFGDFNRRESGNVAFKETEIREFQTLKYAIFFINVGNSRTMHDDTNG